MSRWYRAYEGTCTDPKLGEASLLAECSRAIAIASWHAILESAAAVNDGGRFDTTPRRIAVILCEPPALITSVLDAFSELGLITAGPVTAWSRRQFESDSSTERSRRSRAKKRDGDDAATLQRRRATPPETETETDTSEADASGGEPPRNATDFCKAVFDAGTALLTGPGRDARGARSLIGRWRQKLGDAELMTLIRQSEVEGHSDPAAWLTAAVETRNGNRRTSGRAGHQPSAALELRRRAEAELDLAPEPENGEADSRSWLALSAGSGR